eukprot:2658389-Rhodomonas_salina.1
MAYHFQVAAHFLFLFSSFVRRRPARAAHTQTPNARLRMPDAILVKSALNFCSVWQKKSGLPAERVIGMAGVLDSARMVALLLLCHAFAMIRP